MTLIDDFFSIGQWFTEGDDWGCSIKLNPEHIIYKAHFPGSPVTPGACVIEIATEILEKKYQTPLRLVAVTKARFKQVILPTDEPNFVFKIKQIDNQQITTNVSVQSGEVLFAQLALTCKRQ